MNDWDQLECYVREGSEQAFATLVAQYAPLVHASASRRVGPDLADDVAQTTFLILSRKADTLCRRRRGTLAGWLYRTARFAGLEAERERRRRTEREEKAMQTETDPRHESETGSLWAELRPILDAALDRLSRRDRDAIILRYLQDQPYAAVAEALGVTENTATKCTTRALERLRTRLTRRGITAPATLLGVALVAHGAEAAPTVAAVAFTPGAASGLTALLAGRAARAMLHQQLRAWTSVMLLSSAAVATTATVAWRVVHPPPPAEIVRFVPYTLSYQACHLLPGGVREVQINRSPEGRTVFLHPGETVSGFALEPYNTATGTPESITLTHADGRCIELKRISEPVAIAWCALIRSVTDNAPSFAHTGGSVQLNSNAYQVVHVDPTERRVVLQHAESRRTVTLPFVTHNPQGDTP